MDTFLDTAWNTIFSVIQNGASTFDGFVSNFHFFGPIPLIFCLAIGTVILTKILKRYIKTKRLVTLENEFKHWLSVREEALKCEDQEKGKTLAKNIDKATLNRAYYDFFLESLLLSFVTFLLPVVSMATYLNEYYQAERLTELFGRDYVLKFNSSEPIVIGSLFWFILSVVIINVFWAMAKWLSKRYWNIDIPTQKISNRRASCKSRFFNHNRGM